MGVLNEGRANQLPQSVPGALLPFVQPRASVQVPLHALSQVLARELSLAAGLAPGLARGPGRAGHAVNGARGRALMGFMPPTSTFLVDDSPSFLQSAARFLASDERIEIVGVALSAQEALGEVERLKPALVLMDLTMPGMNGLEATRLLKAAPNPPRVIILTLYDTEEYRQAAQQSHADGFIAKSDLGQKLLPLLEAFLAQDCAASLAASTCTPPVPSPPPALRDGAPETLQDGLPQDGLPQDGLPQDGLPQDGLPQDGLPQDGLPQDGLPQDGLPQPLPLRDLGPPVEAAVERAWAQKRRVLLAEDQPALSHLMAVNMWRAGVETRIAEDAGAALELFESFEPHLILLDATSPRLDAVEVCRSIRSRSNVPILLVTCVDAGGSEAGSSDGAPGSLVPLSVLVAGGLVNVEEMLSCPEESHLLAARVLALLRRFYAEAA